MVFKALKEIEDFLAANQFDQALAAAEQAIQAYPTEFEAYFFCAEACLAKGMGEQAIHNLAQACALSPNNIKCLGRLAETLLKSDRLDEAADYYQKVLQIEPLAWAYIGLGNVYERKGEISQCIQNFQQALQVMGDHQRPSVGLLLRLIKLQKQQNDLAGMIDSQQKMLSAVSDAADKYEALCNLARSYFLLDRYQDSVDHYLQAIEISSGWSKAYLGLADAYRMLENKDEEIIALQKANEIYEKYETTQRLETLMQGMTPVVAVHVTEPLTTTEKQTMITADYGQADLSLLVSSIFQSRLFNFLYYRQQTGVLFGLTEAVEHFLRQGAALGFKPMPFFEFGDYKKLNPDLPKLTDAQCFVHYVLEGRAEKRYYNDTLLRRDASELRINPEFDAVWYASLITDSNNTLSVHEHYLAIGWRYGLPPNRQDFDSKFYLDCYNDACTSDLPPFLHYLKNKNGRFASQVEANHLVHAIHTSDEFDSILYRIQNKKPIPEKMSDILHYICHGVELKLDPNTNFSTEYYVRKYPDILASGMNPFVHYLSNGRREGRTNKFDAQKYISPGKCTFDPNKPTVLVVCHEASRTGAPILGLRLIEYLVQKANIISWNGKEGPLTEDFAETSFAVINTSFDHIDSVWLIRALKKLFDPQVAVVNSAVVSDVAVALHEEKVPLVALVHEYGDYMGIQALQILCVANKVVFPSESVKASVDRVSLKLSGILRTEGIAVRHQGRCIPPASKEENEKALSTEEILLKLGVSEEKEKPVIVLGCGWVQIRKGVECFIDAARICKKLLNKPIRFIWVGGGYKPDIDFSYSVWLRSQVFNSDLEDEVVFFDETPDLAPFFELADVFFLSSRLDPFPNVAIDAVDAGVPIVAFERGTGFSEFINAHPGIGVAVPFLDVEAAAQAICQYATNERGFVDYQSITKQFSFSGYADFVWAQCQEAIVEQQHINEESQFLADSKLMDGEFFKSAHPYWNPQQTPEYMYVSTWTRDIRAAKSRVGFNDKVALSTLGTQIEKTGSITPLAAAIKSLALPLTHQVFYVDPSEPNPVRQGNTKIAVHIHAYNTDSLPSLLHRLSGTGQEMSFYITTNTDKKVKEIAQVTKKYSCEASVDVTPNRGRDVGPFIMMMKEKLTEFDVVGHFHLKGTKELNESVVRQWQNFLYDTLLGKQGEMVGKLLALFENNPKLGLLFQEDPCISSWEKNIPFAKKLLTDLSIDCVLPERLEYPTGNMFWARTTALAPLMRHDWQWADFPPEPVPYDGTVLHAIERLTPLFCELAGLEWATVHNPMAKRYTC